jgi:UTP--glucose-1-phosphate uridylyltransferase
VIRHKPAEANVRPHQVPPGEDMISSGETPYLKAFIEKMEKEGLSPVVIDTFSYYYKKVLEGETGILSDKEIRAVQPEELENAENLTDFRDAGKQALSHSVMIKLNGGLGTSMGLTKAKSLIKVKNGMTFLEIILKQAEHLQVKLALMNSFNTHGDTLYALDAINPPCRPLLFMQHKFPKILRQAFAPANWPQNPSLEWNPPGHGDIYTALYTSGMLQKLLDDGIRYAFISNSDNLGATMKKTLLGYFAKNEFPFMMEVAERAPSDMKGGHIARLHDNRLILREIAQCPENELEAFQNIQFFRFFNTNNIWINLQYLKNLVETHGTIQLPLILNPKFINPRDENSPAVFQIETAMGAAISLFPKATAVKVPRSRLIPVKKCNDLLAVRSDCYVLSEDYHLMLSPLRKSDSIQIKLDPAYYGKLNQLDERFSAGVPSLLHCESLTIEGDVFFEPHVTVRQKAVIKNSKSRRAIIPEGTVIEGTVIL